MRRTMALLVVSVVVVLSACGSGDSGQQVSTDDPIESVRAAAEATGEATSYRFAVETQIEPAADVPECASQSISGDFHIEGALDRSDGIRARVHAPGADASDDVLLVGNRAYVPAALVPDDWGLGSAWLRVGPDDWDAQLAHPASEGASMLLVSPYGPAGGDIRNVVEMLATAADSSMATGREELHGAMTTRFELEYDATTWADAMRASVGSYDEWRAALGDDADSTSDAELRSRYDLALEDMQGIPEDDELLASFRPRLTTWIGDDGHVHAIEIAMDDAYGTGDAVTSRIEIWDEGVEVSVERPPDGEVTDAADLEIPYDEPTACDLGLSGEDAEDWGLGIDETSRTCLADLGLDPDEYGYPPILDPTDDRTDAALACLPPEDADLARCLALMPDGFGEPESAELESGSEWAECFGVPGGDEGTTGWGWGPGVDETTRTCLADLGLDPDEYGYPPILDPTDDRADAALACLPPEDADFVRCLATVGAPMSEIRDPTQADAFSDAMVQCV